MSYQVKKVLAVVLLFSVLLVAVSCNQTEYKDSDNIIEASELEALLTQDDTVVIDARSLEDYAKGHLEGAIHLEPSELTITEPVPGLLAPKETIEKVLGEKGISNSSKVYIYDNNGGVYAGRLWWVLTVYGHEQVKVVNNGEKAIVDAGLKLTLDIPAVTATTYVAKEVNEEMIATIDEVLSVVEGTVKATIIDVRSKAEYDEGAVPTAILYPHTKNLYADGSFKSSRDTYLDYHDLGLERDEAIILYCKTSFRATQTLLVLEEAGFTNVKVYDGAWSEWSVKDVPKAETQESVTPSASDGS